MCVQYWPAAKNREEVYGGVGVTVEVEEQLANFMIRTIRYSPPRTICIPHFREKFPRYFFPLQYLYWLRNNSYFLKFGFFNSVHLKKKIAIFLQQILYLPGLGSLSRSAQPCHSCYSQRHRNWPVQKLHFLLKFTSDISESKQTQYIYSHSTIIVITGCDGFLG